MSARKSSHRTIFLIVSSGSPLALIASSLRSTSKKPLCPMTRSLHPPITACGHRVRFVGSWREEFFEVPFLLNIIPNTIVDAFAKGDILPIVLVSILIGYALARLGEKGRPIREVIDAGNKLLFAAINVLMRLAPIGAFGAMAFTIGRYGISALGPLLTLVGLFYLTSAVFVLGVLGMIAAIAGFNVLKLLFYIKDEILIVLGTASSDAALPTLMEKLELAGCSKPVVGLVLPTGYVFNTDGTSIYMTLAALFVAQATNTDLTLQQQLAIFFVAVLTSKGASGVTGAGFIALGATHCVVPTLPLAGMALILGIDRFMAEARSLVNMIGNAVATVVMAAWEGELDRDRLRLALDGQLAPAEHHLPPVVMPPHFPPLPDSLVTVTSPPEA